MPLLVKNSTTTGRVLPHRDVIMRLKTQGREVVRRGFDELSKIRSAP
jgi:hypothetical protein